MSKQDSAAFTGPFYVHGVKASYYIYPVFRVELETIPVQVEISESAIAGGASVPDGGMVEYLVVTALFKTPGNFRICPEGVFDRLRKAIKVHWEHDTGNKKFDEMFNIELPDCRRAATGASSFTISCKRVLDRWQKRN